VHPGSLGTLVREVVQDNVFHAFAPTAPARHATGLHTALTPREIEVLGLIKLGRTNRQIAEELVISLGTAKNHVEHIISKLGVSDRTQAVVRSLEMGILDLS